jgi:hypothetical protein
MKNMVYTFVGNLVVMLHTKNTCGDAELGAYLAELAKRDVVGTRVFVLTDGGGLTAKQRKELNDVLGGRQQMCAVVSNDAIVRGIVTALAWFNRSIKSFPPSQVEEALLYLKVPRDEFFQVQAQIKRLRAELYGAEEQRKSA